MPIMVVGGGEMQLEAGHDTGDNSAFRGGVGMQSFFEATEESQQLADDNVNHWSIVVTDTAEAGAFHGHILRSDKVRRNIFSHKNFQHPELLQV
jgi:hypothetical protein